MDTSVIEPTLVENIQNGVITFINFVNWLYMVVFILSAWLLNDITEAKNKVTKFMNWFNSIPKALRSFVIGIAWIFLFAWGFRYDTRIEVMGMIFSLLLSMVVYQYGIKKILAWVSKKIGLKF